MASLGKIHLLKVKPQNTAYYDGTEKYYVPPTQKSKGHVITAEVYCGKLMPAKYVTENPKKTTCPDCLKEKFPNKK